MNSVECEEPMNEHSIRVALNLIFMADFSDSSSVQSAKW